MEYASFDALTREALGSIDLLFLDTTTMQSHLSATELSALFAFFRGDLGGSSGACVFNAFSNWSATNNDMVNLDSICSQLGVGALAADRFGPVRAHAILPAPRAMHPTLFGGGGPFGAVRAVLSRGETRFRLDANAAGDPLPAGAGVALRHRSGGGAGDSPWPFPECLCSPAAAGAEDEGPAFHLGACEANEVEEGDLEGTACTLAYFPAQPGKLCRILVSSNW